jgi:suppressor of ftsI
MRASLGAPIARRLLALAIACAWLGGCAGRGSGPANPLPAPVAPQRQLPSPNANELPEPPVVRSVNGVAKLSLEVDLNKSTGQPEFVYQGLAEVAPTIDVWPGDTFVVDVKDNLPDVPPPDAGSTGKPAALKAPLADDINLHFHGLQVSPIKPGDDVITMLAFPGTRLHYVVHIPASQEPGLYWYHPHVHGQTSYQVGASGMSGAIIVEGLTRHLPGLAKMKQRLIIVRATGPGGEDPVDMDDGMSGPASIPDAAGTPNPARVRPQFTNTAPCTMKDGLTTMLNGATHPVISIAPGEKQFFRVVNATGHKTLRLNIEGEKVEVVALDGYALDSYPGTPPTLTESDVIMPPASRAEFVVTGPASGRAKFRTLCYYTGPDGDPDPYIWLGDLVAPRKPDGGDFSTKPLAVGSPLPQNGYSTALPPPAAKRVVILSENAKPRFFINGRSFNIHAPPMFVVHTGTVEAWHVENVTYEIHDFHIHQLHFLVEAINGVKVAHPHWADTAIVPHRTLGKHSVPGSLDLLMDFRDPVIRGLFVFHCHILDHEDEGMMAKIEAI